MLDSPPVGLQGMLSSGVFHRFLCQSKPCLAKLNHLLGFLAFNYSKRGLIMAVETRGPCIIDAMSEGLEGVEGAN